jgi:aromatic-L-amino-acid decarboxylase
MTDESWQHSTGDMSPEAFRAYGYEVVDWIADYFETAGAYPVLSRTRPGEVRNALPARGPEEPEDMGRILHDFEDLVLPGITHWNHPGFLAYFGITGSGPGVLAEMLAAALNVNAMLWRTSPAATELEEVALGWLAGWLGLPDRFEGIIYDTASISTLVAIAAARQARVPAVRSSGMPGGPRMRLYLSEQAHSSSEKDAITLGIGQEGVRKLPTDSAFRMDADALRRAIEDDLAEGWLPLCVVATVGTTSTTSVDPIPAIADICQEFGVWLHVDAAYGGAAALLPERRWIFEGVDRADSLVVNPHKWLFTPMDLSALYSPQLATVRDAFSLVPEYLRTPEEGVRNYMDYGPQLGRRFRALKLWFVLRAFGRHGIENRLREQIRLAQLFASWIEAAPDWETLAPVPFSTVCFRFNPRRIREGELNGINEEILGRVNAGGRVFLSHTTLHGDFTLRIAIGNLRTAEVHIATAWRELREAAAEVMRERESRAAVG